MPFPDSLPIPEEALRIARKLEDAGFETWCVGGVVRDYLLHLKPADTVDFTTAARPEDVQRLFRRTVPVGVEHGTVAVLDRKNQAHEVTTFRKDVTTDGRHAQVAFGVSLDEDLARRDFTINAIAYHPLRHEWRDRFGGAEDLERKVIRAVGDPGQRFREDYLRILRALRFTARFRFQVERNTWDAAAANIEGLRRLSAERVRDEWFKGLTTAAKPSHLLALWTKIGALDMWLPGLGSGEQGSGSVEARAFLDGLARDPVLITSYLSSDPVATLTRLRCSNADIDRGRRIAEHRDAWPEPASDVSVRRWLARVGPAVGDLLAITQARGQGDALVKAVNQVRASGAPLTLGDLAVSGDDLIAAGIPMGPAVGEALRQLLDLVLEDPSLNTKAALLAKVAGRKGEA